MDGRPADAPLALLVLAAGKGTRLAVDEDAPPKVMVECLGLPLVEHVRRAAAPLGASEVVVVTGHRPEAVEAWLAEAWPEARVVRQIPQNGTGHAVRLAMEALPDFRGRVLVLYGDVPQVRTEDLEHLLSGLDTGSAAALLTGRAEDPGLLGRVVRDEDGRFVGIVEARDAADRPEILDLREFNTGLYAFDAHALRPALVDLPRDNAQGEEYATDAVNRIAEAGGRVAAIPAGGAASLLGVNAHEDLAEAARTLKRRILSEHMARGVAVVDPDTTLIEADVEIAPGARVLPFTHIGRGCRLGPGAVVGPFARLRGGAVLEAGAEAGNFVEVKKSRLGPGAKAKHLTYLGDADVGARANIGCGTVTANYDGKNKHRTVIGEGAQIGSGTILVAPVRVGKGARTGANAVVLPGRDVEDGDTVVGVPAHRIPRSGDGAADAGKEEG